MFDPYDVFKCNNDYDSPVHDEYCPDPISGVVVGSLAGGALGAAGGYLVGQELGAEPLGAIGAVAGGVTGLAVGTVVGGLVGLTGGLEDLFDW